MDDYFAGSGGPQQPPAAPPQTWSAAPPAMGHQPPAWAYQAAPQGMSAGVKVLIGIAIGLGGIVVLGILAAIAIPVFLDQRAKGVAAQTTVSMPPVAAGLARRTDATSEQLAQRLSVPSLPGEHLVGAYGGTTSPEVLVTITKHYLNPSDQRDYLDGAVSGAQRASGTPVRFGDVDAGSLGGQVLCSSAPTMTVCFFADAGAYGSAVVFGSSERATELVPQLRAAVERRT